MVESMRSQRTLRMLSGWTSTWFNWTFLEVDKSWSNYMLNLNKFVAGSSQRWAGQHTGCSVGSAWWSETPTDRFELLNQECKKKIKNISISLFSGPFSLSDFVRPYFFQFLSAFSSSQVERTSFFEGTDVEMATLSEEVLRTHNIWPDW